MASGALYTIGYEGRDLDELIAMLRGHRIGHVIDVRELPLSRRRGFSKTPLSHALAAAGIGYTHLRCAGNPYRREQHVLERSELLAKYRAHLREARAAVDEVVEAARDRRSVLLCYEHDPALCHRSILAPRVARRLRARIEHL